MPVMMLSFVKVFKKLVWSLFNHHCRKLLFGLKNWGREGKNGRCLYHCKVVGEDVQDSCEDAICFKSYFISRHPWISKCNFHMLWITTCFTLVFKNASGPNLGWSFQLWKMNYDYFVNNMCDQKIMITPWFGGCSMQCNFHMFCFWPIRCLALWGHKLR
jgi:hypothetical protein